MDDVEARKKQFRKENKQLLNLRGDKEKIIDWGDGKEGGVYFKNVISLRNEEI